MNEWASMAVSFMCLCITLTNVEGSLYLGNKKIKKKKGFIEDGSHHAT